MRSIDYRVGLAFAGQGEHETEILVRLLERASERLRLGAKSYGRFNPRTDARDWDSELLAEVTDAAVYIEMRSLVADAQR